MGTSQTLLAAVAVGGAVLAGTGLVAQDAGSEPGSEGASASCTPAALDWVTPAGDQVNHDVQLLRADCTRAPLVATSAQEHSAALSSDGRTVAYVASSGDRTVLVISPTSGGEATELFSSAHALGDPSWSPDGRRLALWVDEGSGRPLIEVIDVTTRTATVVSSSASAQIQPAWSADGTNLAFTRTTPEGPVIVALDLRTREETVFSDTPGLRRPTWSPDGTAVAAIRQGPVGDAGSTNAELVRLDVSGRQESGRVVLPTKVVQQVRWTDHGVSVLAQRGANRFDEILIDPALRAVTGVMGIR